MVDTSSAMLAVAQIVSAAEKKTAAPDAAVAALEKIVGDFARAAGPMLAAKAPQSEWTPPSTVSTNPGQYVAETREAGKYFLIWCDALKRTMAGFESAGPDGKQAIVNEIVGGAGIPALMYKVAQMQANVAAILAEGKPGPVGGGFLPTEPFDPRAEFRKIHEKLDYLIAKSME